MRKVLISAALLTAFAAATPAAAQYGNYNRGYNQGYGYDDGYRYNHGRDINRQVMQLRQRIDQAARRGLLSRNEANRLFRRAEQIDRLAYRYARNGLTPREHQDLQYRIHDLRQRLQAERREGRYEDRRRWN